MQDNEATLAALTGSLVTVVWPWPWPLDLDARPWPRCSEDVPAYQNEFRSPGFQALEPEHERQTDTHRQNQTFSQDTDCRGF